MTMDTDVCLTNYFLIAMPALANPDFHHTVTYIFEHSEKGAIGIIINKPLSVTLADILEGMEITSQNPLAAEIPVLFGGPINPQQGFVIHKSNGKWDATLQAADNISVTTSRDILQAIAEKNGPDDLLICLGYSGWEPGQLEREISHNFWLHCPANSEILFATPFAERWSKAVKMLCVELNRLSTEVGHG